MIVKIIKVFCFFIPKNDVTHRQQKVAMAKSDYNGYLQNTQNDQRFGVMEEKP